MGLFGNDEEQEARLDALESHVRDLSQSIQANQLDIVELHLKLFGLQKQIEDKVDINDLDPGLSELNKQLTESRESLNALQEAATENWAILNAGATRAYKELRNSISAVAKNLDDD